MTTKRRLRLWIQPDGTPLYIEPLQDYDLTVEESQAILEEWERRREQRPMFLSPGWEIRVLGEPAA
jgi:hypothetical protein